MTQDIPDFDKLSAFIPRLKQVEIVPWWDEYAIRLSSGNYQFISKQEKKLVDLIIKDQPTIGQLNEILYTMTNKLSPLQVISFVITLATRGLLANREEFQTLLPDIPKELPKQQKAIRLFKLNGLLGKAGFAIPIILLIAGIVGAFLVKGPLPTFSFFPSANPILSILALPLAVMALYSLRGLFCALLVLCFGKGADLIITFPAWLPVLDIEKRGPIRGSAAVRIVYYLSRLLFFPGLMVLLALLAPALNGVQSVLAGYALKACIPLILFDVYLLKDSLLILILEEFSRVSDLARKFRTFWNKGFVTIESLFRNKFPKEELFFSMGVLQLLWFAGYVFLFLKMFQYFLPEVNVTSPAPAKVLIIPVGIAILLGIGFFLTTFVPFILRKTAGITVSLVDLGSTLLRFKNDKEQSQDESVDLKQIHIFASVPDKELEKLKQHVAISNRSPYKVLLKEGEMGNTLLAIRKGRAMVYTENENGESIELALLKEGDVFGERAILGEGKRTASVKSLTSMELYVISKEIFLEKLSENIGEESRISEIIMAANSIQGISIFDHLPATVILKLASNVNLQTLAAGTAIMAKGDASNGKFYVIKRGQVKVHGAGPGGEDKILGPSAYFGEISLLNNTPRSTTITTETEVEAFIFAKSDFMAMLLTDMGAMLHLEAEGRRRLAELMESEK